MTIYMTHTALIAACMQGVDDEDFAQGLRKLSRFYSIVFVLDVSHHDAHYDLRAEPHSDFETPSLLLSILDRM